MKRIVIPETKIKYICEISEHDFKFKIKRTANGHLKIIPSIWPFKCIETIKPLAEDEISIENVDYKKIIALYNKHNWQVYVYNLSSRNNDGNCGFELFSTSFRYSLFADGDNDIKKAIETGFEVYEFKNQTELFEWGIKQIKEYAQLD